MVRYPKTPLAAPDDPATASGPRTLGPSRGLVLGENDRGSAYGARDLRRWLRLNRVVFKTDKVDVLLNAGPDAIEARLGRALAFARTLDLRVSLRTACRHAPPDLHSLRTLGLFDLFLTPRRVTDPKFSAWLAAAAEAGVPVRVQLPFPLHATLDAEQYAQTYRDAGVTVVNIAPQDPFVDSEACPGKIQTLQSLDRMGHLADALQTRGIECNLVGVRFCLAERRHWPLVVNERQFYNSHQHYRQDSYELALKLRDRSPVIAGKIISIVLGKHTLFDNPIDNKLLPWLLESPWLRARIVAWHKLTGHIRFVRSVPAAQPEGELRAEKALQRKRRETIHALGPLCGICSLRHICDHETPDMRRQLPGAEVTPQEGQLVMNPMHFAADTAKYYDEIDRDRLHREETNRTLAEAARRVMEERPADREIDSYDYKTEGQWSHQLPGGVRWFGFTNTEKLSTPLAMLDPPFTLSVVFGGGIAEYIGFSLGRDCKLVCPMDNYRHRVVLHVEAGGRYVLLRDGEPVRPVTFQGQYYAPVRLGDRLEPRISVWNIDNSIVTQNVQLWGAPQLPRAARPAPKFSVVTVCVRYARRLQAVIQAVAHQRGVPHSEIEIIVAYVPETDATEDVLDSLQATYPDLTIHRSTFTERKARAKGFIINETLKKATGDWVVLLDADTILPPDFLASVLKHGDEANFIVPDGRKLLSRETTARVLLGELQPWEHWDELLSGEGEFRHREMEGVPIGFCQVVRRRCFDQVKYYEADHFEGADHQFSIDMRKHFGDELRLSGVPVLHLDHGGSKWYGTSRHF
jgi:hypothetical protein